MATFKKFEGVRQTVQALEVAAAKAHRFKANSGVSSYDDVTTQLVALKAMLRKMKLNHMVACKVGLWRKRMPLLDVLVDFGGAEAKTGEEAGELAQLMTKAYALLREIMRHGLPKVSHYCPEYGVVTNGWRFQ